VRIRERGEEADRTRYRSVTVAQIQAAPLGEGTARLDSWLQMAPKGASEALFESQSFYTSVALACVQRGDLAAAEMWIGRAEQRGLVLETPPLNALGEAWAKRGELRKADALLERMDARALGRARAPSRPSSRRARCTRTSPSRSARSRVCSGACRATGPEGAELEGGRRRLLSPTKDSTKPRAPTRGPFKRSPGTHPFTGGGRPCRA